MYYRPNRTHVSPTSRRHCNRDSGRDLCRFKFMPVVPSACTYLQRTIDNQRNSFTGNVHHLDICCRWQVLLSDVSKIRRL